MDEKERTPLYRVENGVAYLTLNRPETLNSFTTDFVHEIEDAIVRADTDDEVRAKAAASLPAGTCRNSRP